MFTVMIGAGGTGTAFAIASRLRSNWSSKIRIIITDIFDKRYVTSSLLADSFHQVSPTSKPSFETELLNLFNEENVSAYIPILNDEIKFAGKLSENSDFKHIDFWSSRQFAECTDKDFADHVFRQAGIKTPARKWYGQTTDFSGPWFLKPRNGFGSRDTRMLSTKEVNDLPESIFNTMIIQELCKGPEITIDSFWDPSRNIGFAYCRERIEVKSGVCTKARLFYDSDLTLMASKIAKAIGQRGSICFQAMKSSSGWVVTDLNLRTGAGTAMTCSAGFDVISAAFALRIGEDYLRFLRPLETNEEFIITRQYSEFIMSHTL